ncbi:MAG: PAS domain S-box protein [Anaerolineales bacterium]|nr:PAS domain S-box protein [Anaerolineales bacterium]
MPLPLRVLILEDSETDAELILYELRRAGYEPEWRRVDNETDYLRCLSNDLDVILADYSMPQFSALHALQLMKQQGMDMPIIVVTGTVGEEAVAECMHQGARDYLLKDRLGRLGSAVERVLQEKRLNDEKRQAVAALRENEEKYRSLFESSPEPIMLIGLDGTILDCNKAAEIIANNPRQEMIGKSFLNLGVLDKADEPIIIERFTKVIGGMLYDPFQIKVTRNDNKILWLEIHIALLKKDDAIYAIQVISRDITKQKQFEQEREKFIADLEAKNAELTQFTYTVSHDLKSPLVTINGYLGYIEQDAASGNMDRLKKDTQRIRDATNKMHTLLTELLGLSRIGRMINAPENVPFDDLVQDAMDIVHGQLEARHITVRSQPNLPIVNGDRQRLTQILQNLIDNAAKYMGDQTDPRIEIGQQGEEGDMPIFYVKDNGIGIDPEFHERIFGLFNKLDAQSDGTGIGLALVKRIIEIHGGRIWVESEAGKGSTFYFTLPRG